MRTEDERTILDMFSYMRPMGSQAERDFIQTFLSPLGFQADRWGNLVLQIGDNPTTLFSSHSDTVHSQSGRQVLTYKDGTLAVSRAAKRRGSNCLGADDTAGVWLMTEMVKANVEGVYVIHYGEEKGCIGSSNLASNNPAFFDGITKAIAFDRAYQTDVITHQMGRRCASDDFAKALSKALGGQYKPSDGGAYTDTNEYTHLVAECTNVSVGYTRQHSSSETQDVPFLIALRDTLVALDWAALPVVRTPGYSTYDRWDDDDWWMNRAPLRDPDSMEALVVRYPEVAASILEAMGYKQGDILDEAERQYGSLDWGTAA